MDTNTVAVVTAFGNKLDGYIGVLADKLGVAAEQLWPVLIQQQVIEGWCGIGFLVLSTLMLVLSLVVLIKSLPEDPAFMTSKQFAGVFIGAIVGVVLLIITCVNTSELPTNIGKIVNSEYYAVRALVGMVK